MPFVSTDAIPGEIYTARPDLMFGDRIAAYVPFATDADADGRPRVVCTIIDMRDSVGGELAAWTPIRVVRLDQDE
jgi:hypothetical protein